MEPETFTAPTLDQLAELLPAYQFESFIAQGGMGAVYKATQRSLDREVAIKILPRELGADPEFRESFETEAKAMAKLNHPNLLGVFDFGDIDGMPYIVMEYVDGQSLYHSAWNVAVEPEQAVAIVKGICDGLGHAHEHGILHRDIKPANILLTPKAEPKIADFGLAQATEAAGTGEVMGTPGYAAPELLHHPEQAGVGTDIYAIGIVLNELLTGTPPDPSGQTALQPTVDRQLDMIWKKATAPEIAHRYHSADKMARDLAAWKPTTQRLRTAGSAAAPARKLVVASSTATTAPIPKLKSAKKGSGTGVLVALALIGVIAYFYFNHSKAEDSSTAPTVDGSPVIDESTTDSPEDTPEEAAVNSTEEPDPAETAGPVINPNEPLEDAMKRLQPDLAAGKREHFPPGTKRRGNSDYLLWETPMSWYEAQAFAESYGAHIATPHSAEEVNWLSEASGGDQTIWIGAGRLGKNLWANIDGKQWSIDSVPSGVGLFGSINNYGILRAGKLGQRFPFFLQWHRDGSNPATLEEILKRTQQTLGTPNPVYPPGTDSLGARRLVIIPLPVNRSEAARLAEMAGGVLAVPATGSDADWIAARSEGLDPSTGIWLGGLRKNGEWSWDTGEAWDKTAWADGADPASGGDGLIHTPGEGWSTADPFKPAGGFAIEWSTDGAN